MLLQSWSCAFDADPGCGFYKKPFRVPFFAARPHIPAFLGVIAGVEDDGAVAGEEQGTDHGLGDGPNVGFGAGGESLLIEVK